MNPPIQQSIHPPPITFGSRVRACDCLLTGRVSMVWTVTHHVLRITHHYRVQFPPGSPFLGDWAVYREGELALVIEKPKLTNLNIVDIMRPRVPKTA